MSATTPQVSAVRILVVDDEPDIVEEIQESLEADGYSCEPAFSARAARRKFSEDPSIGIVLTDIKMPTEDGFQFIEWLLDQHEGDRIFETAIITGHGSHDTAIRALRDGVRDYFQKPLDLRAVSASIQQLEDRVQKRRDETRSARISPQLDSLDHAIASVSNDLATLRNQLGLPTYTPESGSGPESNVNLDRPEFGKLTARQREVVALVANAYSNYQIAYELGITENTVKLYVSQILHTLGLSNRTQLALAATRHPLS
ncbi:response regulator transcription factor [Thioalkalivibrio sp. ALJ24]|uniref:response regulator transcription factor n=1 Tax=Thioalkalivibrio sp. ALJ24 TaxID=545276 RepID=UPI00037A8D4D|nr:response regulator transcription factor [Thioalkalivibrio sp. ALJ24]